jgi:hypothetical protein
VTPTGAQVREGRSIGACTGCAAHKLDGVEIAMGEVSLATKLVRVLKDVTDERSVNRLFENVENMGEINGAYSSGST